MGIGFRQNMFPDAVKAIPAILLLWNRNMGVKTIHMSNTIATPKGGISGRQLKDINLANVEKLAKVFTGRIIAGGGIYDRQDVIDYRNVGATDFSISTVYITKPWHIKEIYNESQA